MEHRNQMRMSVTPSSLGSYFGVGFNTPQEQLDIDLGIVIPEFDEEAQDRMLLGRALETGMLNYFEEKMNIKITKRNTETLEFYDGKIRGKLDGFTVINDVPTVVECKISNAKSYKFTDDFGYYLQCQAYMLGTNTQQAMLCGQWQGKPIYKFIRRDEGVIDEIRRMVDFLVDVFMGLDSFENYPLDILSKYSKQTILPTIKDMKPEDLADAANLVQYKLSYKALEKKIDEIEDRFKTVYDIGMYDAPDFKITLSDGYREGSLDLDRLSIEHPEIDYTKYKKEGTRYRTLRLTPKKGK